MKRRVLGNAALAAAAFVFMMVCAEVGLRVLHFGSSLVNPPREAPAPLDPSGRGSPYEGKGKSYADYDSFALMVFNSFLGYMPRPGHSGRGYHTNDQHFRYDEDIPVPRPDSEYRIFVTGGSTAWGAGVAQEDLYATVAERALQARNPKKKVRVVSAGVGAYTSTNERILVANHVSDFSPDTIVMFTGWNETLQGYSGERVTSDNDYLGAARVVAEHIKMYSLMEDSVFEVEIRPPIYQNYRSKIRYLIDRAVYSRRYGSPSDLEEALAEQIVAPEILALDLLKNVHAVVDLGKREEFEVMLYLQPTLYNTQKQLTDFELDLVDKGQQQYTGFPDYNRRVYELYRRVLHRDAQLEAYTFVDGDAAIANEEESVFADHVHFGDHGNRLIGEHMVGALAQLPGLR